MRLTAAILLTVAVELALGAATFAAIAWAKWTLPARDGRARRARATWARAARDLAYGVPAAVALLAGAAMLLLAGGATLADPVRIWVDPLPFAWTGALATAGCWLELCAGRREATGGVRVARRQARLGGSALLLGVLAQLVVVWGALLFRVGVRRAALGTEETASALALAMLCLGVAAFAGFVAGLAGKPRPTIHFAAPLYALGLAGLAYVAQAD